MLRLLTSLFLAAILASQALADKPYTVRPGDTLQVEVLEDPSLNRSVLVLPDGSISFPMVGSVPAAGRSVTDLTTQLADGLTSNFAAKPNVFVTVSTLADRPAAKPRAAARTIGVYVMGEVTTPGRADVAPGTTILQFLAQAGGFTRFAAQKRVKLVRTDPKTGAEQVYLFNYDGTGGSGGIRGSTKLQTGDVIIVPQRRLFE